jgi:hypothetical protein
VYQNRLLRKIFGANRVEVNVPQPIALSLPSGSVSHNSPFLPVHGHSSRRSPLPITLHGHEPEAQYVLHVTLV